MYLFWPGDWQLGKHIFSQGPTQKYRNPESWTLSEKPSCLVRRRALVMAYLRGFTEEKCYFFPLVNLFYLIYLWYLKNVLTIIGYLLNKAEGKDLCKALHDSQLPVGEVWWNRGLRGSLCTMNCHETEGHLVSPKSSQPPVVFTISRCSGGVGRGGLGPAANQSTDRWSQTWVDSGAQGTPSVVPESLWLWC